MLGNQSFVELTVFETSNKNLFWDKNIMNVEEFMSKILFLDQDCIAHIVSNSKKVNVNSKKLKTAELHNYLYCLFASLDIETFNGFF